jgi:hypothetical protein
MKKLFASAILIAVTALTFTTTSCNEKKCTRCTKIQDASDVKEYCSSDEANRNDYVVKQTHADYNCVTFEQ